MKKMKTNINHTNDKAESNKINEQHANNTKNKEKEREQKKDIMGKARTPPTTKEGRGTVA